ncbi:hypothetical protein Tco_0264452 [Tanacetum coccineum]
MKDEESLNVTFDGTLPPPKTSPLEDDDLVEEEAIKQLNNITRTFVWSMSRTRDVRGVDVVCVDELRYMRRACIIPSEVILQSSSSKHLQAIYFDTFKLPLAHYTHMIIDLVGKDEREQRGKIEYLLYVLHLLISGNKLKDSIVEKMKGSLFASGTIFGGEGDTVVKVLDAIQDGGISLNSEVRNNHMMRYEVILKVTAKMVEEDISRLYSGRGVFEVFVK